MPQPGGPQLADMPRCFAVAERCVFHAATVPTFATRESTSPEPSKWFGAGLGHSRPSPEKDEHLRLALVAVRTTEDRPGRLPLDVGRRGRQRGYPARGNRLRERSAEVGKSAASPSRPSPAAETEAHDARLVAQEEADSLSRRSR